MQKWLRDQGEKLNQVELIKLEKDGLDVIQDIYRYAETGYDSITPDDMNRFKWAGIYEQKPKEGYFMMRVRIPSGILNSEQARVLASIAVDYGRNLVDITTRQAVQFHWLQIQDMPDIFQRLKEVGLSSFEACGDCPRTIVGNPLAGLDPYELIDTRPLAQELNDYFLMNRDFSNLPRKYKISISSSIYNAGHAEINDLAFTPAVKVIDGEEVIGFHVWVGGGLSAKPYLAKQLDVFVRPEEVVKVAAAVTTIFRDYGYREKRHRARLKFLVADWGPEKFCEKLFELTGELPGRGEDKIIGWNAGYFTGVHPQKQEGLKYVGLSVPVGRMTAEELEELARLADKYGDGSLRTCNSQNIVLANIPDHRIEKLLQEKVLERLTPYPRNFTAFAVSCTGNEFCNLALVETKERMRQLAYFLDENIELDEPIRMHMVGCPNSCGQRQIADIGFQGVLVKTPQGMKDAFEIYIGGTLGPNAVFNEKLKGRVLGDDLGRVVIQLIAYYKEEKQPGEKFYDFSKRTGIKPFQERLDQILSQLQQS
ncbi:nitrite/sulfite reductase [Microaerobacter geothermalis]|uniref:nitrite/sulfite reductase n=1 Tax=Microaerobacter geothermalis TaxID=674972 RepID=UPI001F20BD4A|nr:nitrite/sulfite reductase [Microaerobacter geothermalis]MCF6094232.1 nitrite/sulfite reductase [Microaerobacter geothermalis]